MNRPITRNECNGCDEFFDANDYCPRCDQFASEQLPEKTLDELIAERPELRAYRDEVRAKLWMFDSDGGVGDPMLRKVA